MNKHKSMTFAKSTPLTLLVIFLGLFGLLIYRSVSAQPIVNTVQGIQETDLKCFDCPSGHGWTGTACAPFDCPAGQEWKNGKCKAVCPEHLEDCSAGLARLSNGDCVAIKCGAGTSWDSDTKACI